MGDLQALGVFGGFIVIAIIVIFVVVWLLTD